MPSKRSMGFTLIEILIVMIIISIVASVAVLSIGRNQNKRIEYMARQIANAITLAEQQAILQPAVLGFSLNTQAYQFYRFEEKTQQWQPLSDSILGKHMIPADILVKISVTTKPASDPASSKPQLVIAPSGDLTPFTLWVGKYDEAPLYQITGQSNGTITTDHYQNP